MSTVTGFTAERSKEIEDSAIVDGTVSGDNLILIRRDGITIDAGSVRGPQGIQGPGGGDLSGVMELLCPVGSIFPYGGSVAPTGWKLCDGTSYVRTDYPALFEAISTGGIPNFGAADSTHFNVPDLRQRVPIGKAAAGAGNVMGAVGGNKDATVISHSHNHGHIPHDDYAGQHGHTIGGDGGERIVVSNPGVNNQHIVGGPGNSGAGDIGVTLSHVDLNGSHIHSMWLEADATPTGVSGVDANLPPYVVVNYIIRY